MISQNLYNGIYIAKDLDSKYIWMSQAAINLSRMKDYYLKTDHDIPCEAAEYAETFIKQDKEAQIDTIYTLDIFEYSNNTNALFSEKKPIYENENIIGIGCNSIRITNHRIISKLIEINYCKIPSKIRGSYYVGKVPRNKIRLTPKEQEVIFYTIRGMSAKMIARQLNISSKTVEFHIENLKKKFNAPNKYKLISEALEQNYYNFIPESFIS